MKTAAARRRVEGDRTAKNLPTTQRGSPTASSERLHPEFGCEWREKKRKRIKTNRRAEGGQGDQSHPGNF
ncbi:hypothetical protein CapIbe_021367 [Capra ibex]